MRDSKKQQVIDLLMACETKNYLPLEILHPTEFVQHSSGIGNGIDGMKKIIQESPSDIKVDVRRIFQDGDYVFAHVETSLEISLISFHVFKFSGNRVIEHWDNIQERQPLNLSGRSMIDGETIVEDLQKTFHNKIIAEQLVRDVFFDGQVDKLASYFDGNQYIQHNPWLSDDISSIWKVINEWVKKEKIMKYEFVHKILGEGNFVLLMSEGYFHGAHTSFYDLFRIADDKIVEHWDNFESILPDDQRKNNHGKF
ncbi:hypothetical protein [Pedobacter antarcticus]|uniref:nuclear transport factor 2 family protein n=1 Tax=Pedobacter antarcticus TaxID=34086 RepID=UPI002930D7D3|nr:hypothetical protein [Pedobacter antarcticus]